MSDVEPTVDDELDTFLGDLTNNSNADGFFEDVSYEEDPIPEPVEESPFGDATVTIGDGTCNVCGAPTFRPPGFTKAGHKKRTPKYCDLHAPNLRIQETGSSTKGMESQLQRVQEELADDLRMLAVLAGPLLPVTGYFLMEQADPFTIALLKLAKNNQAVLKVLHRVASVAPIYTVAQTVAGAAYAVQVDINKADPHNTIAKRLRVESAYNALYPEETQGMPSDIPNFTGPPRYQG